MTFFIGLFRFCTFIRVFVFGAKRHIRMTVSSWNLSKYLSSTYIKLLHFTYNGWEKLPKERKLYLLGTICPKSDSFIQFVKVINIKSFSLEAAGVELHSWQVDWCEEGACHRRGRACGGRITGRCCCTSVRCLAANRAAGPNDHLMPETLNGASRRFWDVCAFFWSKYRWHSTTTARLANQKHANGELSSPTVWNWAQSWRLAASTCHWSTVAAKCLHCVSIQWRLKAPREVMTSFDGRKTPHICYSTV